MRRLLWIGDACVSSGFARATHHTLAAFHPDWDVHALGINYRGDPHTYPYPVYPCWPGGDLFGIGRTKELVDKLKPDVVLVQNDPWNIPAYLQRIGNVPAMAAVAVDGKNCAGRGLNGLKLAIFWTQFGRREAQAGGYTGPCAVVPLGVDLEVYKPINRLQARTTLELPERYRNGFIVGNVNRNQPRKRLDLCVMYFAEWIKSRGIEDAFFFFHTAPTGDQGYDVKQLAQYYGVTNKLILAEPEIGHGDPEETLCTTYNCFDAMLTTTQGEGWGLPTIEGMACGIPQIVPDWAALSEWTEDAVIKIPCTTFACTPKNVNVIGGIADREQTIEALDALYQSKHGQAWARCRQRGLEVARKPEYRWEAVGAAFRQVVEEALHG